MAEQFINNKYEIVDFEENADIYIINTCTVTNMSDRKSRQIIRRAKQKNPNSILAVTGCYAQVAAEELEKIKDIDLIVGNTEKKDILSIIENHMKEKSAGTDNKVNLTDINKQKEFTDFGTTTYTEKVRAVIKVQDGCNNFCSYCIIPYTRGRSRSREVGDIINEINASNAKEIVLTGINVSDFRINNRLALIDLLEEIDKLNIRFRLSSLECVIIDDEFISRLKNLKNFCPFFHLSLQSATNSVLKRMNRHYTIEEYIKVCQKLKSAFPSCCISTDLIVGFKGETDEEFNKTLENLKKIPFAFIHIFPYSIRKGTNAEKLTGDVPKDVVKKRENILISYNKQIKNNFYEENKNTIHKVLIEEFDGVYSKGYTENYIYTLIKQPLSVGDIIDVKLDEIKLEGMIGTKI